MFPEGWLATEGLGYGFVAFVVGTLLALGFGRSRRRSAPRAEQISGAGHGAMAVGP